MDTHAYYFPVDASLWRWLFTKLTPKEIGSLTRYCQSFMLNRAFDSAISPNEEYARMVMYHALLEAKSNYNAFVSKNEEMTE